MFRFRIPLSIAAVLTICCIGVGVCAKAPEGATRTASEFASAQFRLSPPEQDEPIDVLLDFDVHNINGINSRDETFELTGVLTLTWSDPREAFDPEFEGVGEKFYQGSYQFNEVATGWYPQVILVNDSGSYQKSGVQLRIQPDGTSILKEKITALVEVNLDLRSFPFDSHRLKAVFAVLGHDSDEVVLRVDPGGVDAARNILIPEWEFEGVALMTELRPWGGSASGTHSVAILGVDVDRETVYTRRLITIPMAVIVLLSFSIFWMDKSSLGDRNSVSFIGILTGVAYQHIVVDGVPPVSYFTFMHGFLFISFLIMSAAVPINLLVSTMDKKGRYDLGDRVDKRCRWLFPAVYFGSIALVGAITNLI